MSLLEKSLVNIEDNDYLTGFHLGENVKISKKKMKRL